ncbi:MAG: FIST N-terminal domain-containing protein, partial [Myxococcota bacterium]
MELHPLTYDVAAGTWSGPLPQVDSERTLVLAIGARSDVAIDALRRAYPLGVVVGCGASNASMTDLTVTVASFDQARVASVSVPATDRTASQRILRALAPHGREDLRALMVLGASHELDQLVAELRLALPNVAIAAEQPEGIDVWVAGDADAPAGVVVAVGLYGDSLQVPDPPESAPDLLLVTLGEATRGADPDAKLSIRTTTYDLRTRSWSEPLPIELDSPRTLVLVFGSPEFAENRAPLFELSAAFPRSKVLGCSGAGEIIGGEVRDGILTVAVARFVHTEVVLASADLRDVADSREAGHRLAAGLQCADLRVAFVLTEGPKVDGAELVAGLCEALPPDVQLAGGLAGDGSRFRKTWLLFDGELRSGRVVAAGLCGNHLVAGHGSRGGWEPFGPEHRVTRSVGAVVHELDGRPALDVYQEDLGTKAAELPGSALPFPLAVRKVGHDGHDEVLFRTLVSVDERERSLTFAGDVPESSVATLMRAEWGRLVESAQDAAAATGASAAESDQLAIAVSGMGRRSVLGARTADEMLAVSGRLPRASIVGFYAYGELSAGQGRASLQNHTMTLTTLSESTVAVVGRVQSDGNRPAPTPAPAPSLAPRSVVVETFAHLPGTGWERAGNGQLDSERTVVLAVGGGPPHPELTRTLRRTYPRAHVLGWSAPGQTSLSVTVARFARTQIVTARVPVDDPARSYDAGRRLASALQRQAAALRVVFVVGRAREVRTAELTRGLTDALGPSVTVVAGLATSEDGRGWVVVGSDPSSGEVAAVAFAGEYLAVGAVGRGGVDPYPPERVVTRASGVVVHEIDHRPALSVLRAQLGPGADGPPTGQWFGLWITGREPDDVHRVVAIDEHARTITLDRALPTDARVHLVRDTRAW